MMVFTPEFGQNYIIRPTLLSSMDKEKLEELKKIMEKSACPAGCRCHRMRPEDLCKARRAGLDVLLECLEDEPRDCTFSFPFGGTFYCKCGTRMNIAKLLGE